MDRPRTFRTFTDVEPNTARPSLLPDRPLTPEERAVHDEDPRPGVWAGEEGADLRRLTQEETDALIRAELWLSMPMSASEVERRDLIAIVGEPRFTTLTIMTGLTIMNQDEFTRYQCETRQRGGIDSDPLVRLLAFRAWGDRDRRWSPAS